MPNVESDTTRSPQLGLGSSRTKARTPQRVEALSGVGVVEVSCGMYHTLARTEGGDVYSCGFGGSFLNGVGGLGHDSRAQLDAPQRTSHRKSTVSAEAALPRSSAIRSACGAPTSVRYTR